MELEETDEACASAPQIQEFVDSNSIYTQPKLHPSLSRGQTLYDEGITTSDILSSQTYALCTVHPFTEPPREQILVQTLPAIIHFPKLPFIDPVQLKPIDLSVPVSVTSMTLDPDIANKIQELSTTMVMSHMSEPARSRALVPISHSRNHLRLARKQALSKIGMPSWSDEKKLLAAVKNSDVSSVHQLLQDCVDPNIFDNKRRTPLHIAASQGLESIVSLLIAARADPNRQDILGNTPLHLAVCLGDTHTVNLLLRSGANINLRDNVGRTPLCIVKSRLGTLRRDKSISTDKLIHECQMISDILKIHCSRQPNISSSTGNDISNSTVDMLCNMINNISTREQADEIADTMIEKMSQLCIMNASQKKKDKNKEYCLSIL